MPIERESTTVETSRTDSDPRVPRPRSPGLDLEVDVPRHWFGGNAFATQVANGVNLLFPAGERFFIRSINRYLDRIRNPVLRAQIRGFFGQEGRHAKEHERVFRMLERQGYDVARFLRVYEAIAYGIIERVASNELCLATTAACEHFTALLAENALRLRLLDHAHPTMRALFMWHAAEEIEHRTVAFDVLAEVNSGYALRIAGLALATACLGGFWAMATATLLWQDRNLGITKLRRDRRRARELRPDEGVFLRGIRAYMRPDFHPSQSDTDRLASDYLHAVGLAS